MDDQDSEQFEELIENYTISGLVELVGKLILLILVGILSVIAVISEQLAGIIVILALDKIVPLPSLLIGTGNGSYTLGIEVAIISTMSAIIVVRLIRLNTSDFPDLVRTGAVFTRIENEENEEDDNKGDD